MMFVKPEQKDLFILFLKEYFSSRRKLYKSKKKTFVDSTNKEQAN